MHFLNLYKYICRPFFRILGTYPKTFSSSIRIRTTTQPAPVPLAYSEYEKEEAAVNTENPIFIIHGLLGSRNNWNAMSKVIAATTNRKVVAIDLRNHGDSPHTQEFSYAHMMADLRKLMSELGIGAGKASFVGHSIGGRVAMALALQEPGSIKDLVIVDVSPIGVPPGSNYFTRLLDALESVTLAPGLTLSNARKEAGEQMKKHIRGDKLRKFLLTNLTVDEKSKKFVWKVNLQSIRENFPILRVFPTFSTAYTSPCLFIAGDKSTYLNKGDENEIKKLFPNATFEYVPGAGHLVHSDKPTVFVQIVSKFLNKNTPL